MDVFTRLAEQHIQASQSHLLHIDEVMAEARQQRAQIHLDALVERQRDAWHTHADALTQELWELGAQPLLDWTPAAPLAQHGVLAEVGLQFEQTLASIFDQKGLPT